MTYFLQHYFGHTSAYVFYYTYIFCQEVDSQRRKLLSLPLATPILPDASNDTLVDDFERLITSNIVVDTVERVVDTVERVVEQPKQRKRCLECGRAFEHSDAALKHFKKQHPYE